MELSGVFVQKWRLGWDYQESLMAISSRNDGWTLCTHPDTDSVRETEEVSAFKSSAGQWNSTDRKVLFGTTCHVGLLSTWNEAITMKKLNFKTLFNLNLKFCVWLMVTILDCAVLKNHSLPGQREGYNYNDYMIPKSRIIFFFHSINSYWMCHMY